MATVRVPFVDLRRTHDALLGGMLEAIRSVIDSSAFVLGPEVAAFETEFAAYHGEGLQTVGVASGLDALKIALQAAGVGPGDEVITSANTFAATAFAISATGAKPVFVDVDPETRNLDPNKVVAATHSKTRAILPVHLYGLPADLSALQDWAKKKRLLLLEDCAQAHGATFKGRKVGTWGVAGCFSFYPTKNLGGIGEGGAILTGDAEVAERCRELRNVGQRQKGVHERVGHNSRLQSIQAAVLRLKLVHLDRYNDEHRKIGSEYDRAFEGLPGVRVQKSPADRIGVVHLYELELPEGVDRAHFRQAMADAGVETAVHYATPLHELPCYAWLGLGKGSFPVAERLCAKLVSLPLFVGMRDEEKQIVIDAVRAYFV